MICTVNYLYLLTVKMRSAYRSFYNSQDFQLGDNFRSFYNVYYYITIRFVSLAEDTVLKISWDSLMLIQESVRRSQTCSRLITLFQTRLSKTVPNSYTFRLFMTFRDRFFRTSMQNDHSR